MGAGPQLQAKGLAGCKAAWPCGHSPGSPQVSTGEGMEYKGSGCSWAGLGGWRPSKSLEARGGLGCPRRYRPPRPTPPEQAPLTAVRDVAHDVSGDPQLLHVTRS